LAHFNVKVNACEAVKATAALGLPLLPVEAATLTLQLPVFADELPVNIKGALKTPRLDRVPCPNEAFTPAGNPLIERLAPFSFRPPTGVTFTLIRPVPECVIDSEVTPSPIVSPAACCTWIVTVFVAVTPSPVAVTVTGVELTVAVPAAVSVNVELPLPFANEIPFALHDAVTPLGNPLTFKVDAPVNVPLAVRVMASVAVLPCTRLTELDAAPSVSVGGVSETVSGRLALAVTVDPLFGEIFADRPSVAVPATAAELPVSVSVHTTAPVEVIDAELQLAVIPFGRPDATLMLDPLAELATTAPPAGVAVTVTFDVPSDCMDNATGETASVKLGACVT